MLRKKHIAQLVKVALEYLLLFAAAYSGGGCQRAAAALFWWTLAKVLTFIGIRLFSLKSAPIDKQARVFGLSVVLSFLIAYILLYPLFPTHCR